MNSPTTSNTTSTTTTKPRLIRTKMQKNTHTHTHSHKPDQTTKRTKSNRMNNQQNKQTNTSLSGKHRPDSQNEAGRSPSRNGERAATPSGGPSLSAALGRELYTCRPRDAAGTCSQVRKKTARRRFGSETRSRRARLRTAERCSGCRGQGPATPLQGSWRGGGGAASRREERQGEPRPLPTGSHLHW